MSRATYKDHRTFCEKEGWTDKEQKLKRKGLDHDYYVLTLPDGRQLATKVSHGRGEYRTDGLWHRILKELEVTEEEFWACVKKGVKPDRGTVPTKPKRQAVDAKLLWQLKTKARLSDEELASLSQPEAVKRWQEYLSAPKLES